MEPERIWAKTHGMTADVIGGKRGLIGGWNEHRRDGQVEYIRGDLCIARAASPEGRLADDILEELVRARLKFPGKNVTFAALVEEVGELATATFEESRERVRKEAVQVAVMAMRMILDGDHTFDEWRAGKGLDPLSATAACPNCGDAKNTACAKCGGASAGRR